MNASQLVNMFVRLIMRRVMNKGISKGINAFSQPGKGRTRKGSRTGARRVTQALRMLRRMR